MSGEGGHEQALRAAQDAVDAARPGWDAILAERRRVVAEARADGVTIYRIAQVLGVKEGVVRQVLGLRRSRRRAGGVP